MADSENSRTLPPITHRNLLPATEHFLEELTAGQGDTNTAAEAEALSKWEAWWRAHRECARLCTLQQRLEAELFRTVNSPRVELHIPNRTEPIIAASPEEIDRWLEGEEFADRRARAKAELGDRRREWDAADEIIGYSRAKEAEDIASALEHRLAEELWAIPAGSVVSATAKLHCVIIQGEPKPDTDEFPWPQVRSVLVDLLMTSDPGVVAPSS
jgi:hypothetical protein